MGKRWTVITLVAVFATAISAFIGGRAIVGTAAGLRNPGQNTPIAPGDLETTGAEIAALLSTLSGSVDSEAVAGELRDPMLPYTPPKKPTPVATTPTPRRPSYVVKAVFIDANPTAIMFSGGRSIIVRIGDELDGGRVMAIENDGVTVEGEGGARKYPLSPSK